MTHRESFTLAAVTFLLGAVLSLWITVKWICPSEPKGVTDYVTTKWQVEKIHDTIKTLEIRRQVIQGEKIAVHDTVYAMSDSQARQCFDSLEPKWVCETVRLRPLLESEIANLDSQARFKGQQIAILSDLSLKQNETIQSQAKILGRAKSALKMRNKIFASILGIFGILYIIK